MLHVGRCFHHRSPCLFLSAAGFVLGYIISLSSLKSAGMAGPRVLLLVLIQMEIRTASKISRREKSFSLFSHSQPRRQGGRIYITFILVDSLKTQNHLYFNNLKKRPEGFTPRLTLVKQPELLQVSGEAIPSNSGCSNC